jgi:HK97 family phage major capsid protein
MEGMLASISEILTTSIDAALKQVAEAHTKSNKNKVKAIFGDGEADPKKNFGKFLLAVKAKDHNALEETGSKYCDWDQKTVITTQIGTTGGFLVPTEFIARLLSLVTENSVVRPRATVILQSGHSTQVPALDRARAVLILWRIEHSGSTEPSSGELFASSGKKAVQANSVASRFEPRDGENFFIHGHD